MQSGLTFDPELHEYRFDGIVVPSVTQILDGVGLADYSFVSKDDLRVAQERGTAVHAIIEYHEQGVLDESSVDPELAGYFESYLKMKAFGLIPDKPSAIERRGYSAKFKYAGTLDQLFYDNWINDLKTGQPSPVHGLQFSGYWLMLSENPTIKPLKLTGSYLHQDGSCGDLIEYPYEPLAWLAVNTDYRWRERNGKLKKGINDGRQYF